MIKIDSDDERTKIEMVGDEPTLLAELSSIIRGMKTRAHIPKERIEFAIKLGLASEGEVTEMVKDTLHEKLDNLLECLEVNNDKEDVDNVLDRIRKKFGK